MSSISLTEIEAKPRSASQYMSYMACSEGYRLSRVAKAPQKPAAWFQMGTAVHYVIEQWEKWGRQGTLDQAKDMYANFYDEIIEAEDESSPYKMENWLTGTPKRNGVEDVAQRAALGLEHVENYISWALSTADEWRVIESEFEFNIELGGVQVRGFIDQVIETRSGIIYPRDLKTGSRRPETPFQLAVYRAALEDAGMDPADSGSFAMTKNKGDKIEYFEPLDQWPREAIAQMFANMDAMERLGFYIPEPGSHCRTCPVAEFCRVMGDPEKVPAYLGGATSPVLTTHN